MSIFDNKGFYPTPPDVIQLMTSGIDLEGLIALEPSAGKGDIIDHLTNKGAKEVLYCELSEVLQKTLLGKGRFLCADFLKLQSDQISHIDLIVMNPPFANGIDHLLHAYEIAPHGCAIKCLLNAASSDGKNKKEVELSTLIQKRGEVEHLGTPFDTAERPTGVEVVLITLNKPQDAYFEEFEGFIPENWQEGEHSSGLMQYDAITDVVARYIEGVKAYDIQHNAASQMADSLGHFFPSHEKLNAYPALSRAEFKKELQRGGWKYIFQSTGLEGTFTKGVKEKINKFIEDESERDFTVANIWAMLELIHNAKADIMNEAILESFDQITKHHHENRHSVEGFKTNSHFLLGEKFIVPNICEQNKWQKGGSSVSVNVYSNEHVIDDLTRSLCYLTGKEYDSIGRFYPWVNSDYRIITDTDIYSFSGSHGQWQKDKKVKELTQCGVRHDIDEGRPQYGDWFDFGFFSVKCFKKGTVHLKFKHRETWELINRKIAELKGYPLPEYKSKTKYQERNESFNEEGQTELFSIKL